MERLHDNENIKSGYSNIEVKLHRADDGKEALSWRIYAYDVKSKTDSSAWSDSFPTFDEALADIIATFEAKRTPLDPFVEN